MNYIIKDTSWYATMRSLVGVVAIETDRHLEEHNRTWKAYIGAFSFDLEDTHLLQSRLEKKDSELIARFGAALSEHIARAYFPQFENINYKE